MMSLRLVFYRFTTDYYEWFGFIQYIILLKQRVLNTIRPKLTNIFQVFRHYPLGRLANI